MNVKIKRGVAAVGLLAGTSPSLFPVAQSEAILSSTEHASILVAPHKHRALVASGALAVHRAVTEGIAALPAPTPAPETLITPSPPPESPYMLEVYAKRRHYIQKVISPLLEKDNKIRILSPKDADNSAPGQIILTGDNRLGCAIQFYIDSTLPNHQAVIEPSTWGNKELFEGGAYNHAVFKTLGNGPGQGSRLAHIEGTQGRSFSAKRPEVALKYMLSSYVEVCEKGLTPPRP